MIVNLPGGRRIAVDSKAPLEAFLEAVAAATEEERNSLPGPAQPAGSGAHGPAGEARVIRSSFDPAPDIVVLFLPGESFFSAALEQDGTLIEDAMEKRVMLATPTTLIALLLAVAYGWRQEQASQNAEEISDLGKELYDRMKKFVDYFENVGTGLRRAVDAFNQAVGSLETRVMPSARKFKELGAATGDEIGELETADEMPRALAIPERSELE